MLAKIQVMAHTYVIVATSQTFCYQCIEYIKLDTCAKFHDHQSDNYKVMTDNSKKPMSNRVKFFNTTQYNSSKVVKNCLQIVGQNLEKLLNV